MFFFLGGGGGGLLQLGGGYYNFPYSRFFRFNFLDSFLNDHIKLY